MRWLNLIFLFVAVGLSGAAERQEDGRLYEHYGERLTLGSEPRDIKSVGYPSDAPFELVQSWRFAGQENENSVFKIVCSDVNIPKEGDSCAYSFLLLEDDPSRKEWCGQIAPFTYMAKSRDVKIRYYSGKRGGGRLHCTIQAVYVDGDGNEVSTTTPKPAPTTPGSVLPTTHYRFLPSEEVDSSEHGGEEGEKKTSCACGWANKVTSRIVNGAETGQNEFPFAAALVDAESNFQLCGSTIITEYHAITAAHCTIGSFTYNYSLALIVGAHKLYQGIKPPAEVIQIEKIEQHKQYTGPPAYKHDISLLVLKTKITFGPHVGPACLPTHQVQLDRQYIKIIGWGNLYWQGPASDVLKKVDVRVVTMAECSWDYRQVDPINPTQICTFAKRGASCQGDSGGPVVWVDPETNRYTVVGAVSYGANCGLRPTVHTAIGHYLDWIQQHIQVNKGGQICQKID